MESAYGPAAPPPSQEEAQARLNSYERAVRAALAKHEGPAIAPVASLGDEQLSVLFAPRRLESLIRNPLGRSGSRTYACAS